MSLNITRPISKAIAINGIITDFLMWLETKMTGHTPTKKELADWDFLRPDLAEIVLRHVEAYDQRGV